MYLDRVLAKDEKIMQKAKLHWVNYILPWVLILFGLVTLVIGIGVIFFLVGLYCLLTNRATEMVITNKRVILKTGIIAVKTSEIRNVKIETVRLYQTILGRLLGFGNLIFTGTGVSYTVFTAIDNPVTTKTIFEEVIDGCNN